MSWAYIAIGAGSAAGSFFGSQDSGSSEDLASINPFQEVELRKLMRALRADINIGRPAMQQIMRRPPQAELGSMDDIMAGWKETVAGPMMGYWDRIGGSLAREQANLPGAFRGTDASRFVRGKGENFMMERMYPSLMGAFTQNEALNAQIKMSNAQLRTLPAQLVTQLYGLQGQTATAPIQNWAVSGGADYSGLGALGGYSIMQMFGGDGQTWNQQKAAMDKPDYYG
jgi:hypothetical protein